MRPGDETRMSWHARERLAQRAWRAKRSESVADEAKRILSRLAPDPHADEHAAALDRYASKPRKRTA